MYTTQDLISAFITQNAKQTSKIGVVGDCIIDEYYQVNVSRVSPEFPIRVMQSAMATPLSTRPGGAANLAYLLTKFNANCTLFGFCDPLANKELKNRNFVLKSVDSGVITPRKKRFYQGDYPLDPRWDIEDLQSEHRIDAYDELLINIEDYIIQDDPGVIILSDYGKGVFNNEQFTKNVIDLCNDYEIVTIVDPKYRDINKWKNCTIFKPNLKEAIYFAESNSTYIENLTKILECDALVVTENSEGVRIYEPQKPPKHYKPISQNPVKNTIGAGDLYACIFALAVMNGYNWNDCAIIATNISTMYVQQSIDKNFSSHDVLKNVNPIECKIQSPKLLSKKLTLMSGEKVLIRGLFDSLDYDHIQALDFAKKQGDILIVAIDGCKNDDGTKPVETLSRRLKNIAALQVVDFVTFFSESPYKLIKTIGNIDTLIKSSSYCDDTIVGENLVRNVVASPSTYSI